MTETRRLTNEEYGELQRQLDKVAQRADEGLIPLPETLSRLQNIERNCLPESYRLFWNQETPTEMLAKSNYNIIGKAVTSLPFSEVENDLWKFVVEFIYLEKDVDGRTALETAEKRGLKRLSLAHVLIFGMCHPSLQRYHTLHFLHDPLPWIEASELGITRHSNFTVDQSGYRNLCLHAAGDSPSAARYISLEPFWGTPMYESHSWFGFRRDLP